VFSFRWESAELILSRNRGGSVTGSPATLHSPATVQVQPSMLRLSAAVCEPECGAASWVQKMHIGERSRGMRCHRAQMHAASGRFTLAYASCWSGPLPHAQNTETRVRIGHCWERSNNLSSHNTCILLYFSGCLSSIKSSICIPQSIFVWSQTQFKWSNA
jgi:hypothetical protein